MDTNHSAKKDIAMWNETRWAGCYNSDQGVGLFLHAGRLQGNLDWWWAQTAIYLPGGRVAVERSWAQNPDDMGVNTASLDLRAAPQGWAASFDGIKELTDTKALGLAPRGSSAPSAQARFEVTADGSPLWDMYAMLAGKADFAGDMHVEQLGRSIGTLKVG